MLPEFLGEFRPQFAHYRLDYLKLGPQPLGAGAPTALAQRKLLDQPMILLAQLNFAGAPALPPCPAAGILQLFASPTEWYGMDDYCVLFHPDTFAEAQIDFTGITARITSNY